MENAPALKELLNSRKENHANSKIFINFQKIVYFWKKTKYDNHIFFIKSVLVIEEYPCRFLGGRNFEQAEDNWHFWL